MAARDPSSRPQDLARPLFSRRFLSRLARRTTSERGTTRSLEIRVSPSSDFFKDRYSRVGDFFRGHRFLDFKRKVKTLA